MADEKSKIVTDATGPDAGPAPVQPEAGGGTPAPKQEQPTPEAVFPDKATAPEQAATAQPEKCMRNLPVLLFESVSLFFLLDFSPQLAVDAVFSASALILQAVLDDTSHVSEQAERGKRCRPVPVDTNAVRSAWMPYLRWRSVPYLRWC